MDRQELPGELQDMMVPDDNPEAMFDFLTIQSLKGRYGVVPAPAAPQCQPGVTVGVKGSPEKGFQNETDFETYVQQFPIDDTISQCFATAASQEILEKKSPPVYISGGKRPDHSNQKQRKKFGRKPAYDVNAVDDDGRSRDPKRSKTGGVLSKRHKWLSSKYESKHSKKHVSSSDQSESDSVFISDTSKGTSTSGLANGRLPHDSVSTSDSQITSFSEVFMRNQGDQVVPYLAGNLGATSTLQRPGGAAKRSGARILGEVDTANDQITAVLLGDSIKMIQQLEELTPEDAQSLRDHHGNTLLHRCVMADVEDGVKYLLEKYPEMASDINTENLTAIELAAKIGNYDCLKVILERNQRRNSIGPSLVNRLLTISSQCGQVGCLNLLLQKLAAESHGCQELPRDARGNTAAHLAAKHGHLNCLQTLVASGFDVTSENVLGQSPLHVAHHGRHQACFEYLLLLHVAQDLVHMLPPSNRQAGFETSVSSPLMENILTCFHKFSDLLIETQQMLADCKISVMQTLTKLQSDLELFIKHTAVDSATKRKLAREKLEELASEIERLEDTLEFSPLLETEGALARLLSSVNADVAKAREAAVPDRATKIYPDTQAHTALRCIIRDIHKEFLLENWSVDHVYTKHLTGETMATDSAHNDIYMNRPHPQAVVRPRPHAVANQSDDSSQATASAIGQSEITYANIRSVHDGTHNDVNNDITNGGIGRNQGTCSNTGKVSNDGKQGINEENVWQIIEETQGKVTAEAELEKLTSDAEAINETLRNQTTEGIGNIDQNTEGNGAKTKTETTAVNGLDVGSRSSNDDLDPTERPFTQLLSLDERIDLLIAGERAREKGSDSETLVSVDGNTEADLDDPGSVYTTTFTAITSDSTAGLSDWYNKLGLASLESSPEDLTNELTSEITSESASYWWDQCDDKQPKWPTGQGQGHVNKRYNNHGNKDGTGPTPRDGSFRTGPVPRDGSFGTDVRQNIRLQLETEEPSYEELRRQRLISHLRALEQSRLASDNFCERITTSTGEVMGGFGRQDDGATERIVIDVTGALKKRPECKPVPKPRGQGKQKLFTLEDAIATGPKHLAGQPHPGGQPHPVNSSPTMTWEDMSFTDEEEFESSSWYEMESRQYKSGVSTSDHSTTPQSYV